MPHNQYRCPKLAVKTCRCLVKNGPILDRKARRHLLSTSSVTSFNMKRALEYCITVMDVTEEKSNKASKTRVLDKAVLSLAVLNSTKNSAECQGAIPGKTIIWISIIKKINSWTSYSIWLLKRHEKNEQRGFPQNNNVIVTSCKNIVQDYPKNGYDVLKQAPLRQFLWLSTS